ncbi:MAG: family 1 glycosylhydrolase [Microbacteriaceae bacterium]|nr:family 1 glycosylhydrolase [Microbacteriaceae bacterium]
MTGINFSSGDFAWIAGIEDTCVYPAAGFAMEPLDEYDLTGHTENWISDLRLVRDLGATAVRYGVNWPLVHLARGEFDWAMLDERFDYASRELGLTVIADLVHYGTPTWLAGAFADPDYPDVIAEFAGAFAARYRGIVDHITPLNEPITTASFCGLRGVWPPALTGWSGWTTVMMSIARGITRSIRAIRAANPDAVIVHVEASSLYGTADAALEDHSLHLQGLGTLPTDLVLGRVTAEHPQRSWLLANGASGQDLAELMVDPPVIDLLGVNYYPALTPRTLVAVDGGVDQVATDGWTEGLAAVLRGFSERYGLPLLITETSIEGDDDTRKRWLDDSIASVHALREEGHDIRGYTWWPLLDFVDWSYASGGRNVEEFLVDDDVIASRTSSVGPAGVRAKTPFLRRMGLVRLDERADGTLERTRTSAAERFATLAASTETNA